MLPPGSNIGILGGGQLGRMVAIAAAELGMNCHIFSEEENPPAAQTANKHKRARFEDHESLREFARSVDVLTYEFENVPLEAAQLAQDICPLHPSAYSLEISQDRFIEKWFLRDHNLPTTSFASIDNEKDLQDALEDTGFPAIVKTRRLGYDGKGQYILHRRKDIFSALSAINYAPAIVERAVHFSAELAVVMARTAEGTTRCFDVIATYHENGILRRAECPAGLHTSLEEHAQGMAETIAQALGHVGVLTVEYFLLGNPQDGEDADSRLLVNEIAPRVHNSGHWTRECCSTSQFEQHIRAICGWPLGNTDRHGAAVLTNILGEEAELWADFATIPGTRLHFYGKKEMRAKRKMGHCVSINSSPDTNICRQVALN